MLVLRAINGTKAFGFAESRPGHEAPIELIDVRVAVGEGVLVGFGATTIAIES